MQNNRINSNSGEVCPKTDRFRTNISSFHASYLPSYPLVPHIRLVHDYILSILLSFLSSFCLQRYRTALLYDPRAPALRRSILAITTAHHFIYTVSAPSRAFSSKPVNSQRVSAAKSTHPKTCHSRPPRYSSAKLLQPFDAYLHRQDHDTMIQRKPSTVRKNLPKPVRNTSASLLPSNPTSPRSASTGGLGSRTQLSQSRESQNATSTLTSDKELPDESEYQVFSSQTSVIDDEWELSSNDEEAANSDETSSVSQESEDVAEETGSPLPKRRRKDHDPGPKLKSAKPRARSKTATEGAADRWKYKEGVKGALQPISRIDEMFLDMTTKGWNDLGLQTAIEDLVQRKLRVATMCSGTESPLLALQMINTGKDHSNFDLT